MKVLFAMVFSLLLPNLSVAQEQASNQWTVKRVSNNLDLANVTLGACHVYFQHDGGIRLNTYSANVRGFSSGLYHDITLSPNGKVLSVSLEMWTPKLGSEHPKVEGDYKGPDLFWQNCGKAMTSLPQDLTKRFKGYHGLH